MFAAEGKANGSSAVLEMREAFLKEGCFIFLSDAVGEIQTERELCMGIDSWLMKRQISPGFLWICNSQPTAGRWQFWFLNCHPAGEGRCFGQKDNLGYHRYRIGIKKGTFIAMREEEEAFYFSHAERAAVFCVPGETYTLDGNMSLSFSEESCGQLGGKFLITQRQSDNFFENMQICLCYQLLQVPDEQEHSVGTIKLFPRPSVPQENAFFMNLTPNCIFQAEKTWFSLKEKMGLMGLAQDIYGNELEVMTAQDTRFVFQPEVLGITTDEGGKQVCRQAACLTLDGPVSMISGNRKILCGLNANEFIVSGKEQLTGRFCAGRAAFYVCGETDGEEGRLSDLAQTAYLTLDREASYYSQASEARLFTESVERKCLQVFDYPLNHFDGKVQIPYFPYASSGTKSRRPIARELERMLGRERLQIMLSSQENDKDRIFREVKAGAGLTVTSCGLLAGWGKGSVPVWLGLADLERGACRAGREECGSKDDAAGKPDLRLTGIKGSFFKQFLEKDVLMLYENQKELMEQVSTPYYVDEAAFNVIKKAFPVPDPECLKGRSFETEEEYLDEVEKLDASYRTDEEKRNKFLIAAADFSIETEGWHFQLSPRAFRDYGDGTDTLFFIKYTKEVSLEKWMQNRYNLSYVAMQKKIRDNPAEYEELEQILESREWCGILFLNVPVTVRTAVSELSFLMDGIDMTKFCAAYIAIGENQVKVKEGRLKMCLPCITAMIDYEEPCTNEYLEGNPDIWLRTSSLKVKISESHIRQFNSVSELTMNKFFESGLQKENTGSGNAMIMDGSCRQVEGSIRYVFTLREKAVYNTLYGGITSFDIKEVRFLCADHPQIGLSGILKFWEDEECDLLSYGNEDTGLPFSLMLVEKNDSKCWKPDYTTLTCEAAEAGLRKNSFLARFPADFLNFSFELANTPQKAGYVSISSPVKQGEVTAPFFCMCFCLNLGSLGALADNLGTTLELCAAWSTAETENCWFVGMRSGKSGGLVGFTVQSILNVGFKTISIRTRKEGEFLNYYLEFRNFRASLAGYQFPPGNNTITVFSDSENPRQTGWYAAYLDK